MNIEELQKKINEIEYWDLEVLDLQINYFGDEVIVIIYNDDTSSWKLSFLSCYMLNYQTDSNWRTIPEVKNMKRPQLGYYGQDISIKKNQEYENFIDVKIDFSIMNISLSCKDILIEKIDNSMLKFFWNN